MSQSDNGYGSWTVSFTTKDKTSAIFSDVIIEITIPIRPLTLSLRKTWGPLESNVTPHFNYVFTSFVCTYIVAFYLLLLRAVPT